MKIRNIILGICGVLLISGCFKDEGNYAYLNNTAPVFDFTTPTHIYCYEGDSVFFEGKFHLESPDSLERMADFSYEWKVNGVVLCREKDFRIATDKAMELLNLKEFPSSFLAGTYGVIDNETGLTYLTNVLYNFRPSFGTGNWMILSKNGLNSRLSYQRLVIKNEGNKKDSTYKNYVGIYKERNDGEEIMGTPRFLLDHMAPHISSYSGATLVVTEKEAYEISNESLRKAKNIKEEFLSGVPEHFAVKDAYYVKQYSFLVTDNGNMYRRVLSENYLGGKFITQPYVVDDKGYEIDFFANGQTATWSSMRLLYDRKNRRMLMSNQQYTPMGSVKVLEQTGTGHVFTPWALGDDIEMLAISEIGSENWDYGYDGACYCAVYNQNGKTYLGYFYVNNKPPVTFGQVVNNAYMRIEECPVQLSGDNLIRLTSEFNAHNGYDKYILYSSGNEIRYINRVNLREGLLIGGFADRITAFRFDIQSNNHKELGVGLANGDFMRVDVRNKEKARVFVKSKFNVGGEIVDVSVTGGRMYNAE